MDQKQFMHSEINTPQHIDNLPELLHSQNHTAWADEYED